MTNVWKLLRLTTLFEFLPVLLVSLMALFTGLALLGASAWLVASAALMPPLYTLALGITTVRACGIGRAVFRYGERYLSHRMAFRILTEIRTSFYDRAAKVLPLRSGPARQGEFLHDLLTGADELRDFYVRALLPIAAIGTITALTTWLLTGVIGPWALALPALYLARLVLSCASRIPSHKNVVRLYGLPSGLMCCFSVRLPSASYTYRYVPRAVVTSTIRCSAS